MSLMGRYEIVREIGRGAMGIVYLGKDPKIDRSVALKCLRPNLIEEQEEAKKRFQREALALGRLIHPNIIQIFDAGEDPASGAAYIVMEYLEGISLAEIAKSGEPLSLAQSTEIAIQVCHALDFAHSKGVVHRDIKPGNVLLSPDLKKVKVTDFGIARLDGVGQGQTGRLWGTPQYMSPEQCRGEKLDGRSDLFAVGALLYELLTHRKAFPGENIAAVMRGVLAETPVAPELISPEIPKKLSDAVMMALEKNAGERFSSGLEMATALAAAKAPASIYPPSSNEGPTLDLDKAAEAGKGKRTNGLWTWALLSILFGAVPLLGLLRFSVPVGLLVPFGAGTKQGEVDFITTPDGAEIWVDGAKKGMTPLTLALPAGDHELRVTKQGHHPLEATLNILPAKKVPVDLKLTKEEAAP